MAFIAAIGMMAFPVSADAQLGNLGKLKDAAKSAVNKAANGAQNTLNQGSSNASVAQPLEQVPQKAPKIKCDFSNSYPLTVFMKDEDDFAALDRVKKFVAILPTAPKDSVIALRAKLVGRHTRNQEIIDMYSGRKREMESEDQYKLDDVKEEDANFDRFYAHLSRAHHILLTYEGSTDIEKMTGTIGMTRVSGNSTTYFTWYDDPVFHSMSGDKVFLPQDEVDAVMKDMLGLYKIMLLCEDVDSPYAKDAYIKCYLTLDVLNKAVENNKPENMERRPMPKGSSLNSSLNAKALAAAKQEQSMSNVTKCVITTDWEVERNAFGEILRRKCGGYIFYKDEFGLRANRVQWAQDYMGGGNYGATKLYGTGMESFYVQE